MSVIGPPRRPEIDEHVIKFLVGAIALSLPVMAFILTKGSISSISESFWYDKSDWPRNVFVGFLFAIAAFLLAYNGKSEPEMWLGKLASASAIVIAMYPCGCGDPKRELIPHLHVLAAGVMFLVLACFCFIFYRRARDKGWAQANARALIYALCGAGMVVSILLLAVPFFDGPDYLVFWGEAGGLVSFGISWLTASRVLPVITTAAERETLIKTSSSPLETPS